jgi:hypothetical protein
LSATGDGVAARPADRDWRIHPHGAILALEENLWTVTGEIPGVPMALRRTMTVVRLSDGRLVLHSVIALGPAAMAQIEAWGEPSFVVVPSGYHRIDAPAYKRRYPRAVVISPRRCRKRVEQRVAVDGGFERLPEDPALVAEELPGAHEGVLIVSSGDARERATLVFKDVFFNQDPLPGIAGRLYDLLGSTGGPKVPPVARWFLVDDRRALRAHLERLAGRPDLVRIIPGHGEAIDVWPGKALAKAAAAL